jgi:transcriptional regulator
MGKGNLSKMVAEVISEASVADLNVMSQHDRHQAIVRRKILASFSAAISPKLESTIKANASIGDALDEVFESVVASASKDGLDLDGEMLELLSKLSGDIFAIQSKLVEVRQTIQQSIKGT